MRFAPRFAMPGHLYLHTPSSSRLLSRASIVKTRSGIQRRTESLQESVTSVTIPYNHHATKQVRWAACRVFTIKKRNQLHVARERRTEEARDRYRHDHIKYTRFTKAEQSYCHVPLLLNLALKIFPPFARNGTR